MLNKLKPWQKIAISVVTIGVTFTTICYGIDKYRKYAAKKKAEQKTKPQINPPVTNDKPE